MRSHVLFSPHTDLTGSACSSQLKGMQHLEVDLHKADVHACEAVTLQSAHYGPFFPRPMTR